MLSLPANRRVGFFVPDPALSSLGVLWKWAGGLFV